MNNEKILATLPCNDESIFVDEDGFFRERIGIAYIEDGSGTKVMYITNDGEIYNYVTIIGRKGEVINLRDLQDAFGTTNQEWVISQAKKYFTIRTEDLQDTIELRVKFNKFKSTPIGYLYVKSDFFPSLCYNCDVSKDDFIVDITDTKTIEDSLIPTLKSYSDFIGKRVKVKVYFEKICDWTFEEKELDIKNQEIAKMEELHLPRLRRFINEKLDKMINSEKEYIEDENKINVEENKLYEKYKTRYDMDPNLGL